MLGSPGVAPADVEVDDPLPEEEGVDTVLPTAYTSGATTNCTSPGSRVRGTV
jgi:hypothetical protein